MLMYGWGLVKSKLKLNSAKAEANRCQAGAELGNNLFQISTKQTLQTTKTCSDHMGNGTSSSSPGKDFLNYSGLVLVSCTFLVYVSSRVLDKGC